VLTLIRVVLRQQALGNAAVPFPLGPVLLVGVLRRDGTAAQILSVHGLDCHVGRLEAVVVDKGKALGGACLRVAHALGRVADDDPERRECIVKQLFVDIWV